MKTTLPLIATALLALSACGSDEPEVVGGRPDPMADQLNNAAPVELPPMVKESHSYRCKDGSLLFVDYMSDDKTANVRTEKNGAPTVLKAPEVGQPYSAEGGYALSGGGEAVSVTLPGKGEQSCKR